MRSRLGRAGDPVPCVRCERREPGLSWGDYCSVCRAEDEGYAVRGARRAALVGAALMGVALLLQRLGDFKTRLFGAASVLLVYVILRRLLFRAFIEYRRRGDRLARAQGPSNEQSKPGGQSS